MLKTITYILFYTFFVLTFCPAVQMATMSALTKCNIINCIDEEKTADLSSDDCCPIQMCNSCQCCFCYFNCPVDSHKIEIRMFESITKNAASEGQYLLSEFSSDLWQPPRA